MTKESLNIEYKPLREIPSFGSEKNGPSSMEYTPDGKYLIVGYSGTSGVMRFLELEMIDLENVHQTLKLKDVQALIKTKGSNTSLLPGGQKETIININQIVVTNDSKYFAVSDNECGVCLFKKDHKFGDP